jgi:hypothetical protein
MNDSAADVLRNEYKLTVSENGARCAELLRVWLGGLHHFPGGDKELRATDWSSFFVAVRIRHLSLDTYDGDRLTRLVLLAHDHAIRVGLSSEAMKSITITLHPRPRDGGVMRRHPTIEEALAMHRRFHPEAVR